MMANTTRTISVVIPTLNRPQAIVDAVRDLQAQDYPRFEVIVVDSSSATNEELTRIALTDQRVKILRVGPRGTCYSRNAGVQTATGEVIVFTDDDVRIQSTTFLTAHAQPYSDQTVGGVGGRLIDANLGLNRQQSGPVCRVTATGRVYANATATTRQDINAPRGGNMSFRRPVIMAVGGFDEQFRGNAMREETDFSLRVVKAGWRIVFEPAAELTHLALPGGSRSRDRLSWYRDFFFNESYFFLKHFPRTMLPILLGRKLRPIMACWLYYGRGRLSWFLAPWRSFREARQLVARPTP